MKVGRNDQCVCGSGLKFKKCCINKAEFNGTFGGWRTNALQVLDGVPHKDTIYETCFHMLELVEKEDWSGACHATTAVLHVLFTEQGVHSIPCVGEAKLKGTFFDHSWVEIGSNVYDVAIYKTLVNGKDSAPVVNGKNVSTLTETEVEYGAKGRGLDPVAKRVVSTPFVEYLDGFPHDSNGLWGIAKRVAAKLDLDFEIDTIKDKYKNTTWTVK